MDSVSKCLFQPKIIRPQSHAPNRPNGRRGADYKDLTIFDCQTGFPIRKSADQRVLSPPHGLSQSATSFIASYRLGIHQTPFSRLIRASESVTWYFLSVLPLASLAT